MFNSSNNNAVLDSPRALASLRNLCGLTVTNSNYAQLPENVRARVRALKNLQLKALEIEKSYFDEVHALECKFEKLYEPLMRKRYEIVTGQYEPRGSETEIKEDLDENLVNTKSDPSIKGIPSFWLTAFLNVDKLASKITEADEEILKHLIDVRLILNQDPMSFKLEFEFEPNEFFSNKILTKTYYITNKIVPEMPFAYEGPEITSCEGTKINWLSEEKNVTKKLQDKIQKSSSRGIVRKVKNFVECDSFFKFFDPPKPIEDIDDKDYQAIQMCLDDDFDTGEVLRQAIVHEAVLCFTGEALLDDDDDYDSLSEDLDEDEEEED